MDLAAILEELHSEKRRVESAIASLESMQNGSRRRGRKFRGAEERQQVSERMTRYWAKRRSRAPRAFEARSA